MDSEAVSGCNPPDEDNVAGYNPTDEGEEQTKNSEEAEGLNNVAAHEEGSSGGEEEADELLAVREPAGNIQQENVLSD